MLSELAAVLAGGGVKAKERKKKEKRHKKEGKEKGEEKEKTKKRKERESVSNFWGMIAFVLGFAAARLFIF